MTARVQTVEGLLAILRLLPPDTKVRVLAELPDDLKGEGVHAISGDLARVEIFEGVVVLSGKG